MIKIARTCLVAAVAAGATLCAMAEEPKPDTESAKIVQRMKEMRLPEMEFAPPQTIIDAVRFFSIASKKYDSAEIPKEERGFTLGILRDEPEQPTTVLPMIKAQNISFYDALELVCESIDCTFEVQGSKIFILTKQFKEELDKAKNQPKLYAFSNYRFCVDSTKEPTDCMQLSEFVLFGSNGKAISREKFGFAYNGTGGDDNFGVGETPERAVDRDRDTKWLDFRANHEADEDCRSRVWIEFKFSRPTVIAGYRWYTADDCEDRDPRSWRLLGSNDDVNWTVIDKVEDFEATSKRCACAYTARLQPSMFKTSTPEGWLDDYDAALEKAAAENKYVLIDFSGSDWCAWCERLDKEVFATDEFRKGAAEKYVLLMVDNPSDDLLLTQKAAEENPKLEKKFDIVGFPTVVVLDSMGEEVARTGYRAGGPENYLKMLDEEIRFAPEIKKYIKPIRDAARHLDEQREKNVESLERTMDRVIHKELYPKYVSLYEKLIEDAKSKKVPAEFEERMMEFIKEIEGSCNYLRNEIKEYEEDEDQK